MLCIALLGDALIIFIEMIIFWLEFDLSKQYLHRNITILILAHFGTYVRLQVLGIQACTKKNYTQKIRLPACCLNLYSGRKSLHMSDFFDHLCMTNYGLVPGIWCSGLGYGHVVASAEMRVNCEACAVGTVLPEELQKRSEKRSDRTRRLLGLHFLL